MERKIVKLWFGKTTTQNLLIVWIGEKKCYSTWVITLFNNVGFSLQIQTFLKFIVWKFTDFRVELAEKKKYFCHYRFFDVKNVIRATQRQPQNPMSFILFARVDGTGVRFFSNADQNRHAHRSHSTVVLYLCASSSGGVSIRFQVWMRKHKRCTDVGKWSGVIFADASENRYRIWMASVLDNNYRSKNGSVDCALSTNAHCRISLCIYGIPSQHWPVDHLSPRRIIHVSIWCIIWLNAQRFESDKICIQKCMNQLDQSKSYHHSRSFHGSWTTSCVSISRQLQTYWASKRFWQWQIVFCDRNKNRFKRNSIYREMWKVLCFLWLNVWEIFEWFWC